MKSNIETAVFWFRRDLRLNDNAALYHALTGCEQVQPVFIFDTDILNKLVDEDDARISFILMQLNKLNEKLQKYGSSLAIYHTTPEQAWAKILIDFHPSAVYYNHDYEPYARARDQKIEAFLKKEDVAVFHYKDQVIFEKDEVLKADGQAYTVFSPYKNKWLTCLDAQPIKSYPSEQQLKKLHRHQEKSPTLKALGFEATKQSFPDQGYKEVIPHYGQTRDYPAQENGTTHLSVHLRFGTVSIRQLVKDASAERDKTWLNELIWREFYMMILWHFPQTVNKAFKPRYDRINWRNHEKEFEAWCAGQTGYPLVDAGMRQLNETGFMHNRVRMIVASFLCKHLLIDWRWGEAYFARKLQDYEQSSNIGGWQWAAGSGTDAVPYFRIFNPELQLKKFDPQREYIKRWVPEYSDPFKYPQPIVGHKKARERALNIYKKALNP